MYTVLVEGDDHSDPIADAARAILDGHIVLSRQVAESGLFPAIDLESSVSRLMVRIADDEQLRLAQRLHQLQAFRLEYEQRLARITGAGIDARQLADYRRFLSQFNEAIERQGQEVQRSQSAVEDSREALRQRAVRREDERREQKLSDEAALLRSRV